MAESDFEVTFTTCLKSPRDSMGTTSFHRLRFFTAIRAR